MTTTAASDERAWALVAEMDARFALYRVTMWRGVEDATLRAHHLAREAREAAEGIAAAGAKDAERAYGRAVGRLIAIAAAYARAAIEDAR